MDIRFTIKQLGKRQAVLTEKIITIDYHQSFITLENLIVSIVTEEVNVYTNKTVEVDEKDTIHTPLVNYIDLLTETGKAGFDGIYNSKKADVTLAKNNALICFEDGVFAVFQGDDEITTLAQEIDLSKDLPFTFIRLTFLAGSYW